MYQAFQPVKVTGEHPQAGRAGTIRGDVQQLHDYTEGQTEPVAAFPVQLDGDDAPQLIPADNIRAI